MVKHFITYKMVNGDVLTFEEKQEELITATKISLTKGEKAFALHGETLVNLSNVITAKFTERKDDEDEMTPEEFKEWV